MSNRFRFACLGALLTSVAACASNDALLSQNDGADSAVRQASFPSDSPSGVGSSDLLAPMAPAFDTFASGAQQLQSGANTVWTNASNSTARGWANTKRMLTPPAFASSKDGQPSFWQRMWAPQEPYRPQTTREFLSQPRPKWGS